jgi:hypothetical protein
MRRCTAFWLLAALGAALLAAGPASALPRSLANRLFGPQLVRAEVLVKDAAGVHVYRIDRGRLRSVSGTTLTLLERDGAVVTVPVGPDADVRRNGNPVPLARLRRNLWIEAIREGDAPAHTVRATGLARNLSLAPGFYGPRMVRAQVIVRNGTGVHDYRVDRGRVRSVSANAVTLLERDGTLVTIPVAAGADIRLANRPVRLLRLRRGMWAETVREGEAPAFSVHAARAG